MNHRFYFKLVLAVAIVHTCVYLVGVYFIDSFKADWVLALGLTVGWVLFVILYFLDKLSSKNEHDSFDHAEYIFAGEVVDRVVVQCPYCFHLCVIVDLDGEGGSIFETHKCKAEFTKSPVYRSFRTDAENNVSEAWEKPLDK